MKGEVTKLAMQFRSEAIERSAIDADKRTVEIAFSSEFPVERWWGKEVLSHDAGACDLSRMNDGAAVLVNHSSDRHIGVVESARIDAASKKGRAVIRFGKSALAEENFQAVQDGILRHVSVGYRINRIETVKDGNGENETDRVTSWEPVEVSLVAVPADPTVGVGRVVEKEFPVVIHRTMPVTPAQERTNMAEAAVIPVVEVNKEREQAREQETARVRSISTLCKQFAKRIKPEDEAKWIADGTSEADVRKAILDRTIEQTQNVRTANPVELSEKETNRYSFLNVVRYLAGDLSEDQVGFEMEVSRALEKAGKKPQRGGVLVPTSMPMVDPTVDAQRAMEQLPFELRAGLATATGAAGGYSVQTTLQSLIELLRNRMMVRQLGATVLSGLSDTLAFPKQLTSGVFSWVAENPGSDVTDADLTLGQITMSPKMGSSSTSYSRKLIAQTSLDIEALVRNDLISIAALGLDLAAINGSGSSNQPTGILNTSGVDIIALGTNGGQPVWGSFIDQETHIAAANADIGTIAHLMSPEGRGYLKKTAKIGSTFPVFIWDDGEVNGYRAEVSNQIPKTLVKGSASNCHASLFGVWSTLMIGEWGALEVIVDPYRLKKQGMIEITTYVMADIALRYPTAFSVMKDFIPL